MRSKYAEVWTDPDMMQWVASYFVSSSTDMILAGNHRPGFAAMWSSFFEQRAAILTQENDIDWDIFVALCDWGKMCELYKGDDHTLVSFSRKRIPCKCLDNKYKEVKSITKIGRCHNPNCSLPDKYKKTVRSEMLYCTQCRRANYCSRECQVAHWPFHKEICAVAANMRAARKSGQKKKAY